MWMYVAFFVIIALAVLTIVIRVVIRTTVYYDHVPDLHGKTFVITGPLCGLIDKKPTAFESRVFPSFLLDSRRFPFPPSFSVGNALLSDLRFWPGIRAKTRT